MAKSRTEFTDLLVQKGILSPDQLTEARGMAQQTGAKLQETLIKLGYASQEQVISGDRWGGPSSRATELEERIKLSDPRLLLSALHVTDAFKKIVEATVTNASEAMATAQGEKLP